jgi:magnesium-transporting ATPase (P-type)
LFTSMAGHLGDKIRQIVARKKNSDDDPQDDLEMALGIEPRVAGDESCVAGDESHESREPREPRESQESHKFHEPHRHQSPFPKALDVVSQKLELGTSAMPVSVGVAVPAPHELTPAQLSHFIDPKNPEALAQQGGVSGLAHKFCVSLDSGLTDNTRLALQQRFGKNILPGKKPVSLWRLMLGALLDKILLLLTAAAFVSLGIGIYQDVRDGTLTHWIEGAAILVAVVIVVLVNALNDYQREIQFRKLSERADDRLVNILRDGKPDQLSIFDLTVGDVVILEPGVLSF